MLQSFRVMFFTDDNETPETVLNKRQPTSGSLIEDAVAGKSYVACIIFMTTKIYGHVKYHVMHFSDFKYHLHRDQFY